MLEIKNERYQSYYYTLRSSQEIDNVVAKIASKSGSCLLVYLASYMQNTVLFHNLKTTLEKTFPKLRLHVVPNIKDNPTELIVFTYKNEETLCEDVEAEHTLLFKEARHNIQARQDLYEAKNELVKRYFLDSLTRLPNHYQLRHDLDAEDTYTYIVVHIDNFKLINDFYGFIVGDFLLECLSETLRVIVGDGRLYKTNGADFAILLADNRDFYALEQYLKNLNESCKGLKYQYHDNDIFVDLTFAASDSDSKVDIFSKVNMALQYAKNMRLPYWIYEDSMQFKDVYESNLRISIKVREAIENSGIVPYFQPILSNKTGKIIKYECLARLVDSQGNVLPPNQFLPIAKTIKVYSHVTTTIMDKAFEVFKDNEYPFTLNISIDDIMSVEIYNFIMNKLKETQMGNRVIFELLESEHIEDYNKVSRFITEVRRLGAKVAIDDFGSGFSNFSYLSRIKVDYLKIDGSLIKNVDSDKNSEVVVQTIVDFAKKLGIETIAEYVHSSTVLAKVKLLGIDFSQGYYIDEPLPRLPDE